MGRNSQEHDHQDEFVVDILLRAFQKKQTQHDVVRLVDHCNKQRVRIEELEKLLHEETHCAGAAADQR